MKHCSGLLLAVAAVVASPGQGTAQHRVNDHSSWGLTAGYERRVPVWRPSVPLRPSNPIKRAARLTVLSGALPTPPRPAWRGSDAALASAFTALLLVDAGQTRGLARDGWRNFREANPLLGPRPEVGRVSVYTAVAGLGVLGAAAALPPRLRSWLLGGAVAIEAITVAGNARQGIPVRF